MLTSPGFMIKKNNTYTALTNNNKDDGDDDLNTHANVIRFNDNSINPSKEGVSEKERVMVANDTGNNSVLNKANNYTNDGNDGSNIHTNVIWSNDNSINPSK